MNLTIIEVVAVLVIWAIAASCYGGFLLIFGAIDLANCLQSKNAAVDKSANVTYLCGGISEFAVIDNNNSWITGQVTVKKEEQEYMFYMPLSLKKSNATLFEVEKWAKSLAEKSENSNCTIFKSLGSAYYEDCDEFCDINGYCFYACDDGDPCSGYADDIVMIIIGGIIYLITFILVLGAYFCR